MGSIRQHQGGWVARFVIIGVVLVVGLLGTIYYIRTNNAKVADSNTGTATNSSPVTTNNDTNNAQPDTKNSDSPDAPKSESTVPKDAPTSSAPSASTTPSPQASLPQTGPSDSIVSLLVVGAVSFSMVSYLRSRDALKQL